MIEEGKAAPLFTLKDARGTKVSLKGLRGKNVIVYFYPRDDTPGCIKEACGFRDLHDDFAAANTVIIGVSPDGTHLSHVSCPRGWDMGHFVRLGPEALSPGTATRQAVQSDVTGAGDVSACRRGPNIQATATPMR